MSARAKFALIILIIVVFVGVLYLPRLGRGARSTPPQTDEEAQREIAQQAIATPSDVKMNVNLFWASTTNPGALEPQQVELALSPDNAQRCRQLIAALAQMPPTPAQRTLPADTELLDFYLLTDGTAIADFTDSLSTETPSGILSEQVAVQSITQTLAGAVPQVQRLKILLHGQEADTLAGHLDLTGFFTVAPPAPANALPTAPTGATQPPGKPDR
jgi:spore germination protein GerM